MIDLKKPMSKYRECQDCKCKFTLSRLVLQHEFKFLDCLIYCPKCESSNTAIIPKEEYEHF